MKTLIAIPCLDMVRNEFFSSMMNLRKTQETAYAVSVNSMIHDSRNTFCANAIMKGYDRVLWVDSDMQFDPDLLERLSADMDETKADYVSALCFKRVYPTSPVIYREIAHDAAPDGTVKTKAVPMNDYPRNALFRCAGTGFGAVLVSVPLIRDVWERFGPPFQPMQQMGEDLTFCWRVGQLGREMYCDSRVKVGHVGSFVYDENVFLQQTERG